MKQISLPLSISLIIISLIIGITIGYYISPQYQQTMYSKEEMGFGQADRFIDLRYINQMAAHHRDAMLLGEQIANKTQRQEIKDLAAAIQEGEPKLINELYSWKKDWYRDNRKVKDPVVAQLGEADDKTDLRFLNALIAHHEAGITMTQEIRTKSSRKEILDNADAVELFLSQGVTMLKGWRTQWYGIK